MGEIDRIADFIDKLTKDPTVRGTVTVRGTNDAAPRPRYQTCRIDALIEAPGLAPVEQSLEYVVRRDFWPAVGDVLPADVHTEHPERTEIDWDAVSRSR